MILWILLIQDVDISEWLRLIINILALQFTAGDLFIYFCTIIAA